MFYEFQKIFAEIFLCVKTQLGFEKKTLLYCNCLTTIQVDLFVVDICGAQTLQICKYFEIVRMSFVDFSRKIF